MVFLQRMLIILPKCQDNNNYVFLGSQDFYAISKKSIWNIQGVQNSPYEAKSGGKIPNFMGFLQRKYIILPECQDNNENVFLGSQDVYAISKKSFRSIQSVRNSPYYAKSGGKMPIFIGFLQRNLIILPKCQGNNENVFLWSAAFYPISKKSFQSIQGV